MHRMQSLINQIIVLIVATGLHHHYLHGLCKREIYPGGFLKQLCFAGQTIKF